MKQIKVIIPRYGIAQGDTHVSARVEGEKGKECSKSMSDIIPNPKNPKEQHTEEYFQPEEQGGVGLHT